MQNTLTPDSCLVSTVISTYDHTYGARSVEYQTIDNTPRIIFMHLKTGYDNVSFNYKCKCYLQKTTKKDENHLCDGDCDDCDVEA